MKGQIKVKIIFVIICVSMLLSAIKLFCMSYDEKSKARMLIFKEQYTGDELVLETGDVKIIANNKLIDNDTMIKEFVIVQRNPFILSERENSILFQIGGETNILYWIILELITNIAKTRWK